jgi:hypothetical protein
MKKDYENIWNLALPYLKRGVMKDFVLHTKGVVKSMEMLLEKEHGEESTLVPAAILHDVGWSAVPESIQKSKDDSDRKKALRLHIEYAAPIIREVLGTLGWDNVRIERVVDIVTAHKFQDPTDPEKRLLIDADTMSDAFKEQFYSDVKSYYTTPQKLYEFRKGNNFYTKTAKAIFNKELEDRKNEFMKEDRRK